MHVQPNIGLNNLNMQKPFLIALLLLLCIPILTYAKAEKTFPAMKQCIAVNLQTSDGWWLTVYKDGSGLYGYGTACNGDKIKNGVFNFKQVYQRIQRVFHKKPKNAESAYISVSCFKANTGSAYAYRLAVDAWLNDMFSVAQSHAQSTECADRGRVKR